MLKKLLVKHEFGLKKYVKTVFLCEIRVKKIRVDFF